MTTPKPEYQANMGIRRRAPVHLKMGLGALSGDDPDSGAERAGVNSMTAGVIKSCNAARYKIKRFEGRADLPLRLLFESHQGRARAGLKGFMAASLALSPRGA